MIEEYETEELPIFKQGQTLKYPRPGTSKYDHNKIKTYLTGEVEGNGPLEDYFCHLSQNGIHFLSRQVWLIGLNNSKKSSRREVIDTHVFDHVA